MYYPTKQAYEMILVLRFGAINFLSALGAILQHGPHQIERKKDIYETNNLDKDGI